MKFDYLVLAESWGANSLEKRLKELGLQGWEAVSMSQNPMNLILVVLKKEIH